MSAAFHNGGLLIAGASRSCGKTVVTTGIAAALGQAGIRVQAFKPLVFARPTSLTARQEQGFINAVTGQYMASESWLMESPEAMTVPDWNRLLETASSFPFPALIEAVGQVATPWAFLKNRLLDVVDVAQALNMPVLLVCQADETFIESTRMALSFLQARGAQCIGFIRVSTTAQAQLEDWQPLMMSQQFQVPFLGEVPFSPSISVLAGQQGNLIRITEESIDLLPVQRALGIHLS